MPEEKVKLPSILLLIASVFPILFGFLSIVLNLVGIGAAGMGAGGTATDPQMAMFSGTIGIVSAVFGILWYSFVAFGAWKMSRLESYGISMAAAIMAGLPCSLCCILTMPLGIWSLVVINDTPVKDSFRS